MTIAALAGPSDAVEAIAGFMMDHGRATPAGVQAVLATYHPSPVARLVAVAEALYAAADGLAEPAATPARTLCAQLADLCVAHQLHHIGQTPRGEAMAGKMRRLLGLPGATPAAQDPPPQLAPGPL